MKYISFIKEMIKNPKDTGAITPSFSRLSKGMIDKVDFSKDINIIEYGPGTGSFTELIIKKLSSKSNLYIIEKNEYFIRILEKRFSNIDNVYILHEEAFNISEIVAFRDIKKIDYFISGIPFTSIPKEVTEKILNNTLDNMGEDTILITFQYSNKMVQTFSQYFDIVDTKKVYLNLPPAKIFHMRKKIIKI